MKTAQRTLPIYVAVAAAMLFACTQTPDTLQCPSAEPGNQAGELGETAQQLAVTGKELDHGSENAIASAIASLRSRHPEAKSDAIVNDLITAYCPSLNHRSLLDRAAKQKAMTSFSEQVRRIVDAS